MEYNNYSISFAKGQLYLKSKEPKSGYEEVTYGLKNDKKTYHKYEKSTGGKLKSLDLREVIYEGKTLSFLELSFERDNELNKISAPLKNTKGNYTDEVKSIVSALNFADKQEEYTFSVNKKTTESKGKEYTNINIYLNYVNRLGENGKGLSTGYIPYLDIPKAEKEEDEDLGTTWNWKPVNKFYAVKIKGLVEKLNSSKPSLPPAPVEKATVSAPNAMLPDSDEELPF